MASNFVLKKLFPNFRLALSAGERIPVLSRKFFWTCGRILISWVSVTRVIYANPKNTVREIGATPEKRDLTILGRTHTQCKWHPIILHTHTVRENTRFSCFGKKEKNKFLFFFSLWGWRCVFCVVVVVGRMKLFVSNGMQGKNQISPRSAGSSF